MGYLVEGLWQLERIKIAMTVAADQRTDLRSGVKRIHHFRWIVLKAFTQLQVRKTFDNLLMPEPD